MTDAKIYTALGLMSGTSLDGIDVAIIQTDGTSIHSFGPFETKPYHPEFRGRLREAMGTREISAKLERELTHMHAELIQELSKKHDFSTSLRSGKKSRKIGPWGARGRNDRPN